MRRTVERQLKESLYREHLEEISFLYEQRELWLDDPEVGLSDIAALEARMEAHLDALVVGKDHALEFCEASVPDADFGELHGAIRVYCREQRLDLVRAALGHAALEDEEVAKGVGDALKHELPATWSDELSTILRDAPPEEVPLWANAIAYRRLNHLAEAVGHAAGRTDVDAAKLVWSLGKLRVPVPKMLLYRYLQHADWDVSRSSALALLRYGEVGVANDLLRLLPEHPSLAIPISISSGPSAGGVLAHLAKQSVEQADATLALGLLGNPSSLEPLLELLLQPGVAAAAATALHIITGAPLVREVFVPEEPEDDDDAEDESPLVFAAVAGSRGSLVQAVETDPTVWRTWLGDNKDRFQRNTRFRLGRPVGPGHVREELTMDVIPRCVRGFIADDHELRYGADFEYESDQWVRDQLHALAIAESLAQSMTPPATQGRWYFMARPIA